MYWMGCKERTVPGVGDLRVFEKFHTGPNIFVRLGTRELDPIDTWPSQSLGAPATCATFEILP
jgi:hypothetical protein